MKNVLALALLSLSFSLSAQEYSLAAGGRLGSANGLSVRGMFSDYAAGEAIFAYRQGGLRAIGLLMCQRELGRRSGSFIYIGAGGHAGAAGFLSEGGSPVAVYGADAVIGFEYVFPHAPFSFSLDYKPEAELRGGFRFSGNNAGVSLRYIIR